MNAVDIWLVVATVLFGVAALISLPKLTVQYSAYALALVASGLMCFLIATLVERN